MVSGYSHNKDRPSYAHTQEEYEAFYRRIEAKFNVEDLTKENLKQFIGRKNQLIDTFILSKNLLDNVKRTNSIRELNKLNNDADTLLIHRNEVKHEIFVKKAELLKKALKSEKWKDNKTREVIREKGMFISWRVV